MDARVVALATCLLLLAAPTVGAVWSHPNAGDSTPRPPIASSAATDASDSWPETGDERTSSAGSRGVGESVNADAPENETTPVVEQTITYRLTPANDSSIEVTFAFEVDPAIDEICVKVPADYVEVDNRGFNQSSARFACRYRWNGHTQDPSMTFRVPTDVLDDGEYEFYDAGDWALAAVHSENTYRSDATVFPNPVDNASDPRSSTTRVVEGGGAAGDPIVYIGDAEVDSWQIRGETVRLVVHDGASVDAAAVRAAIEASARNLSVGARQETVTIVTARDPIRGGGLAWRDSAWVHETASPSDEHNIWVHEYVHTRQEWDASQRMEWFTEGSADYYAALASYQQGSLQYAGFYDHVSTDSGESAVLANTSTTGTSGAAYTKGRRVAAALDRKIRYATDGNRTLEDVLYLMNRHEGEVTYPAFKRMVERVAGRSFDAWLDTYVTTSAAPRISFSEDWLRRPPTDRDADGDGANETVEKSLGLDPFAADTDEDGVDDGTEIRGATDPLLNDTDGDGIEDGREREIGTDSTMVDTDGDDVTDSNEIVYHGTDPTVADTDGDGLEDRDEVYEHDVNATVADTDADGLDDGAEHNLGTDPSAVDTDEDGVNDSREAALGIDPTAVDSDSDGVADGTEVELGTDSLKVDTDDDGVDDATEVAGDTDPTDPDSDGDGIADGEDAEPTVPKTSTIPSSATTDDDTTFGSTPGFGALGAVFALLAVGFENRRRRR